MQKAFRNVLVIAIIGVIIFGLFSFLNGNGNMPKQLTYTQFVNKLNKGDLKTLEIQPEQNVYMVSGKTKKDEDYSSTILYNNEKDLQKITDTAKKQDNLKFTVKEEEKQSVFVSILTTLIPVLIIALLFIFFLSQAQGGGGGGRMMNFGKSKAKMYDSNKRRVRFSDVAGADEEKQELIEIVDFLKDNKKFKQMGSRIPKGVLLVGPPGTGKTLLARAVAVKLAHHSSQSVDLISLRCLLVLVRVVFVIYSKMLRKMPHVSFLLMKLMLLDVNVVQV